MNLFTKAIREQLIKNHKKAEGSKSSLAYVKLFNPTGKGTWYLSELDPETNVAFGLCEILEKELGYVNLDELSEIFGPFGLGIERDKYFPSNKHTLEECKTL